MSNKNLSGTLVFHRYDSTEGVIEREVDVGSLKQLFSGCLQNTPGEIVDRVVLDGLDQNGSRRRLTLSFHSELLAG